MQTFRNVIPIRLKRTTGRAKLQRQCHTSHASQATPLNHRTWIFILVIWIFKHSHLYCNAILQWVVRLTRYNKTNVHIWWSNNVICALDCYCICIISETFCCVLYADVNMAENCYDTLRLFWDQNTSRFLLITKYSGYHRCVWFVAENNRELV